MPTHHFCKITCPHNEQHAYSCAINENPLNALCQPTNSRSKRAVGFYSKFWSPGRTITITFTQALPEAIKARVEQVIRMWEPYVNLKFEFEDSDHGDIRIALNAKFNESVMGTDALSVPSYEPTLSIATPHTSEDFNPTLLHEFGHALGLSHEHQHPSANIPWDKEKAFRYFQETQGWTLEEITYNLFDIDNSPDIYRGSYDPHSIMHYEILNDLTIGDWTVGYNTELSEQDKISISNIYPPA